ncbi:pantoate--beta-alanine ligase [Corynebacterium confusum]
MIETSDLAKIRMVGSAYAKTGRPVVLVILGDGVHAGHQALIRAARAIRSAVVVVALREGGAPDADVVWHYDAETLWPHGKTITAPTPDRGLEPVQDLALPLALIGALRPSDVVVGEKDYEYNLALNQAVRDLHLGVNLHGVPTVRNAEGVAMSLRNTRLPAEHRTAATAISAALTAGAHAAEAGAEHVLEVTESVLRSAGVDPDYVAVRGKDLGPAPEQGDARLLVATTLGGIRLIDNVGLPLGVGFKNWDEYQSEQLRDEAELLRSDVRGQ